MGGYVQVGMEEMVKEYDAEGKVLREIRAPGGPHSAVRLPDGNTLVACGDMGTRQAARRFASHLFASAGLRLLVSVQNLNTG